MREIKFRGMDIVNNKWLYGNLEIPLINQSKSKYFIISYSYGQYQKHEVDHKTIGQYTGLKDRNGKEIYEGDILKLVLVDWSDVPEDIFTVSSEQFVEDVCYLKAIITNAIEVESQTDCIEVIGNIYENQELLEG